MSAYKNIGLLFNKHYFKNIDFKNIESNTNENVLKSKNSDLFNSVLLNNNDTIGNEQITLTTTYPGLFSGSGYPHETGVLGELKLGLFFDFSTGLPVIPGSSVKGVLRDAFEKAGGDYVKEILQNEPFNIDQKKLEEAFDRKIKIEGVKGKVSLIVADIFHGIIIEKNKEGKEIQKQKSVYKRDIFLDAFPVNVSDDGLLGNDYITPHKEPLKNPVPLQFLKVMPCVTFRFDFILHDYKDKDGKTLTADNKKELFKQILLDLGIGAKTNVGYGQFTDKNCEQKSRYQENSDSNITSSNETQNHTLQVNDMLENYTIYDNENFINSITYEAEIIKEINAHYIFKAGNFQFVKKIDNIYKKFKADAQKRKKKGKPHNYNMIKVGDKVTIEIKSADGKTFTVRTKWF